jgi:hypothetical protein
MCTCVADSARKYGGLPRGVAAADDDDLLADAEGRLHRHRGVVHACALELRNIPARRPAVFRPGGNDHRSRRERRPAIDLHSVRLPLAGQPGRPFGDHHLRAELQRLCIRPPGQVHSGNAGRKPEIVLDP